MNLDDEISEFIRINEQMFPDNGMALNIEQQRKHYDVLAASFNFPYPDGIESEDVVVTGNNGDIPMRIYRHKTGDSKPTLVYLHGGGWILGGLESHDSIVAEIASRSGVNAVSVDYRLAPEHRYPAAFDDAYDAICYLKINGAEFGLNTERLAVAGDSAGGNLATACCLRTRDEDGPNICAQILIYPALAPELNLQSHDEQANAPLGTKDDMLYYYQEYFGKLPPYNDAFAMPLAADDFSDLPPAFVLSAEYDVLRDDAKFYAQKLKQVGVSCNYVEGNGLIHGFLRARRMSGKAADAMTTICDATRRLIV